MQQAKKDPGGDAKVWVLLAVLDGCAQQVHKDYQSTDPEDDARGAGAPVEDITDRPEHESHHQAQGDESSREPTHSIMRLHVLFLLTMSPRFAKANQGNKNKI